LATHVVTLTPLKQVENVTTRVSALEGVHTVLHHTSILTPSMLLEPVSWDVGPLPQQYVGGLALSV
jgi:hypothetical protein